MCGSDYRDVAVEGPRVLQNMTSNFLSVAEVATTLGFSRWTVLRLLRSGELPGVKIGRKWVIPADFFERLAAAKRSAEPLSVTTRRQPTAATQRSN